MKNPYDQPPSFEKGFAFDCEGKKYMVNTGSTETQEGTKYRLSIRSEADTSITPLFEYSGINADELKEAASFLEGVAGFNMKIDDVISHLQNLIIDRTAESRT